MKERPGERRRYVKERYLNSFIENDDGSYTYRGEYFTFPGGEERFLKLRWIYPAQGLLSLLCFIVMGFLPIGGTYVLYVSAPFVLSVFPACVFLWKAVVIFRSRGKMTEYEYLNCSAWLNGTAVALVILGVLAFVGMAVFRILRGADATLWADMGFALCGAVMAASDYVTLRKMKGSLNWSSHEFNEEEEA